MSIINKNTKSPIYEQIYEFYKKKILSGELVQGTPLPPTRKLAENLGVSRNTINNAYAQLSIEGYVSSRIGANYVVNDLSISSEYHGNSTEIKKYHSPIVNYGFKYDFGSGRASTDIFPIKEWKSHLNKAHEFLTSLPSLRYPDQQGEKFLREAISTYIYSSRGIKCSPDNIIITSGLESSIQSLIFSLEKHDYEVVMENPGYHSARKIFQINGLNVKPIEVDDEGIKIEKVYKTKAKLMYVTPSHQFPTGAIMSIQRRIKAIDWASKNDAYIIEDDYDSELRYNAKPSPTLYSLDKNNRVIYLGTFSKSLSPDLRIAFMILPDELMYQYYRNTYSLHCCVPSVIQIALASFINSGGYARHVDRLRANNKRKNTILVESIKKVFGNNVSIKGSGAGHHILINVNSELEERELIDAALNKSIKLHSVSKYWFDKNIAPKNTVMMGYGGVSEEKIEKAVKLLYEAWFGK